MPVAIETTYTLKATAQGFDAAGRAVDELNKKATKGQREAADAIKKTRDELARLKKDFLDSLPGRQGASGGGGATPGLGPAIKPRRVHKPRAPEITDPRITDTSGFGPAFDPEDLPGGKRGPTRGGGGRGGGGGGRRPGTKTPLMDEGALSALRDAYHKATLGALDFSREVSDNTAILKDALPTLKEYGEVMGRMGRGGRSGGGGGGGGPRGPAIPPSPPGSAAPSGPMPGGHPGRGAFLQGLLESMVPGVGLLQRGGGVMSQVAGRAVGGMGRAAYMAPFSGVGGVQKLLDSIPVAGPVLAAMSGLQYGNAGSALGFEQQQQQMLPFLGRTGVDSANLGRRGGGISLNAVGRQGMRLAGADRQTSQGMLAQLAQASGTTADNYDVFNALAPAMAAQTACGVGPDVAGSFVQGQRLAGPGGGRGGAGFVRSLAQGNMGMGLNGAELIGYMREMAEGISSFRETGIPIATDSIGALGTTLTATGISGTRAGYLANSFQRTTQNIGMNGPQSFSDFRLLQAVNGKPLRGVDDTLQASEMLEEGLSPDQTRSTLKNYMRGNSGLFGKGRMGEFIGRQELGKVGIRLNTKEYRNFAADIAKGGTGGLSEDQLNHFGGALQNYAQGNVSGVTASQASINNQNLSLGQGGLEAFFKAEGFQRSLATAVNTGLNPLVNTMVDAIQDLTRAISLGHLQEATMSPAQAMQR